MTVYGTPPGMDRAFIDVVSLEIAAGRRSPAEEPRARYLPTGHLIYTNRSTMFAVPFDLDARETRGTAVPVLNDIAYDPAAGMPQFGISRDGTLVYRRGVDSGLAQARSPGSMLPGSSGRCRPSQRCMPARHVSLPMARSSRP